MMVSSEKVDSGKFHGGRSNFSQTCNLLSQYLKEKGSFGDLNLSLSPNSAETKVGTMNLLPKIEAVDEFVAAGGEESDSCMKSEQMTIFYAGQVIVLDNFPAEKAKELMTFARSAAFTPPESAIPTPKLNPIPVLGSDLPIARKNSLARFLEKRKDRITSNAPYQASKPVKAEPWLELGSEFPLQIQHQ